MKRQLAGGLPVVAPVVVGSKHNEAKVVEKRDCASDCEALYELCDNVSSNSYTRKDVVKVLTKIKSSGEQTALPTHAVTHDTTATNAPAGSGSAPLRSWRVPGGARTPCQLELRF